jgi:hypothetical protein
MRLAFEKATAEGDLMTGRADRRSVERRRSQRRGANGFSNPVFFGGTWCTGAEIIGYAIEATDGPIGRVADLCVEEESSVVTGMVVITRRLLPLQKRVFVPLNAIERVDAPGRKIYLRRMRHEVKEWSTRRRSRWGRWLTTADKC